MSIWTMPLAKAQALGQSAMVEEKACVRGFPGG
jgi:hypothetical protein